MLTRMKKMLKKQKGFTLVELLAVIAILAIVVAIAIPTVGKVVSNSEAKAHTANVALIENAARLNAIADGKTDEEYTIEDLENNGYLESIPDDVGDNTYTETDKIKVVDSKATYTKYKESSTKTGDS